MAHAKDDTDVSLEIGKNFAVLDFRLVPKGFDGYCTETA